MKNTKSDQNTAKNEAPEPVTSDEIENRRDLLNMVVSDLIGAYHFARLDAGMSDEEAEKWSVVDTITDIFHDTVHNAAHTIGFESRDNFKQLMHSILNSAIDFAEDCVAEGKEHVVDNKHLS